MLEAITLKKRLLFNETIFHDHIEVIAKYSSILSSVMAGDYFPDNSTVGIQQDTYPLAFVMADPDAVSLHCKSFEYQSTRPIKLGKEVKSIVTNTFNNQIKLNLFLDENKKQLCGSIATYLFEDLHEIRKDIYTTRNKFNQYINNKYKEGHTKGNTPCKLEIKLSFIVSWYNNANRCCLIKWILGIFSCLLLLVRQHTLRQCDLEFIMNCQSNKRFTCPFVLKPEDIAKQLQEKSSITTEHTANVLESSNLHYA